MHQCTICVSATGITRNILASRILHVSHYRGYDCCPGNRRIAELQELSSSFQSILTDSVCCDLGKEPSNKYGWTALSIFATANDQRVCCWGDSGWTLLFTGFNGLGSAYTKPYPSTVPCSSSVLSSPLSTAFGALQLSSVWIEGSYS